MSVHMLSLDIKALEEGKKSSIRFVHMCVYGCLCLHHFQLKAARCVNLSLEIVCARCDDDIIASMQSFHTAVNVELKLYTMYGYTYTI